jgi:3-oxoacyl-[acyl-carrier-protein] synthase-3
MYAGAVKRDNGSLQGWMECPPEQWLKDSVFAVKQDVRLLDEHIARATLGQPLDLLRARRSLDAAAVDWFLPHLSSHYFIGHLERELAARRFVIPRERWFTNLETKGNTGSASIYIALEELFNGGRLRAGQRILLFVPESGRFSAAFVHLTVV